MQNVGRIPSGLHSVVKFGVGILRMYLTRFILMTLIKVIKNTQTTSFHTLFYARTKMRKKMISIGALVNVIFSLYRTFEIVVSTQEITMFISIHLNYRCRCGHDALCQRLYHVFHHLTDHHALPDRSEIRLKITSIRFFLHQSKCSDIEEDKLFQMFIRSSLVTICMCSAEDMNGTVSSHTYSTFKK